MQAVMELLLKAAAIDSTVLIEGESGTGKELAARAIHFASPRSEMPFVVADCAAINPNLIESELFGHVEGAFTGAGCAKNGLIRDAHKGTLFLDEIGELPSELQVKLLRLLQEKTVKPVGSSDTIRVDIRVIAATNKNMADEMAEGRVRKDFYYRLNVIPVKIPPLRERLDDIPLLAKHFIEKLGKAGMNVEGITPEAIGTLKEYSWPGNVRELENVIERSAALGEGGTIDRSSLPDEIIAPRPVENWPQPERSSSLKDHEKNIIIDVMCRTGGNVETASRILNVHRSTLYRKLKKYKLD
jgi:transcriptional regulator with PAS, ATPase and Fis domain